MILDVACTAIRRPKILEMTFKTFRKYLFKNQKCRLIINVDPIGEVVRSDTIINICKEYFEDVYINTPETPNFIKAWKWVFSNCESKYIFHLQDDWKLNIPPELDEMMWYLDSYENLACIRLLARHIKGTGKPLDGKVYINNLYVDHPALWKLQFYKDILPYFNINYGTEYQVRGRCTENADEINKVLKKWNFGLYRKAGMVIDLGRDWLENSNLLPVYDNQSNLVKLRYNRSINKGNRV